MSNALLFADPELVTDSAGLVVSLPEAKLHCRIDSTDEDSWIQEKILAATEFIERSHGVQLLTTTYDLPLLGFWGGLLRLPRMPLQSVTSVKYYDDSGVQQTINASQYLVRTPRNRPGSIYLAHDQVWPSAQWRQYPVTIRFVAGFASAAVVPHLAKQAICLLVAHWYENREAALVGTISKEIEFSVSALLDLCFPGGYA